MDENDKEWPRVHTCLRNWCPKQSEDCKACDKVLEMLRNQQALGKEFSEVLAKVPYAR